MAKDQNAFRAELESTLAGKGSVGKMIAGARKSGALAAV